MSEEVAARVCVQCGQQAAVRFDAKDWCTTHMDEIKQKVRARAGNKGLEKLAFKIIGEEGNDRAIERLKEMAEKRLARVGRNEPCSCGSGKKFKKCCLEA